MAELQSAEYADEATMEDGVQTQPFLKGDGK